MGHWGTSLIRHPLTAEFGVGLQSCRGTIWRLMIYRERRTLQIRWVASSLLTHSLESSVKDANAEYIQKLRVNEWTTIQEIEESLNQLFNSNRQGNFESEARPSVIAATAISKIQLDNTLTNSLYSSLQNESPYSEILLELSGGRRQVLTNDLVFKKMNGILAVHDQNEDKYLDFWRIVVPDKQEIKTHIVQEMHSTPYSAHPGI